MSTAISMLPATTTPHKEKIMNRMVVRKSDGKIVSFGTEDTSRFNPAEFDIMETDLEVLPGEIEFCFYENGEVVVDEALEEETREKEAEADRQNQEARQHIALENLAGLTNEKIDNWVDNNITDLAGAKTAFKKLAKWCRALTRCLMLRQDD